MHTRILQELWEALPVSRRHVSGSWGPDYQPQAHGRVSGPMGAKRQTQRRVAPSEGNEARRQGPRESHSAIVLLKPGELAPEDPAEGRALPADGPSRGNQAESSVTPAPVTVTLLDSGRGVRWASVGGLTAALPTRPLTNRMP